MSFDILFTDGSLFFSRQDLIFATQNIDNWNNNNIQPRKIWLTSYSSS